MANECIKEWNELNAEFRQLQEEHRLYCEKVSQVKAAQKKCISAIAHQRYRIKQVLESAKKLEKDSISGEEKEQLRELQDDINKRKDQFRDLEDVLPHENGIYLKIVLGSVNVSLLSKQDKYLYKDNYERFKLYVTLVNLTFAICIFFYSTRFIDAAFQFLQVWYYCTLTIREHILKMNGSRIKGWWILHHFISTAGAGFFLIWPDGYTYVEFRIQFVIFSMYLSIVQVIQYYYQSGTLYRLRALGERHTMDITVEGFQSWMFRGLSFLFPFLIFGYFFQLYNAYVLYRLSQHPKCVEWQVWALSILFFILFLGNIWTAGLVLRQKIKEKMRRSVQQFSLKHKYRFTSGNGKTQ